ncbi:MAG: class I SAM-dependent methyltransferase [Alistipes sp.]|nr:class I SAM-dependent methyltransferase [Candidatus Alistipes equi]
MDGIDSYIRDMSKGMGNVLEELERETFLRTVTPRMLSGAVQGRLLNLLVKILRPKSILEIGTFTGYSAICMGLALGDGALLDTCDRDDEHEDMILSFIKKAGLEKKINFHIGSALDVVPQLGKSFDMVYLDGNKREYPAYYNMLFDTGSLHSGSVILADNILWYGKVATQSQANDTQTIQIKAFNTLVRNDSRVENVILPLRDGLNLIRVL